MMKGSLWEKISRLKKSAIREKVNHQLALFSSFQERNSKEWFSELCFCILTGNAKLKTALEIEKELKHDGYLALPEKALAACIKRHHHRFHNTKAKFIAEARQHCHIKEKLAGLDGFAAREWLVANVKGLGYKESSHFLRNVGCTRLAIVDRHIMKLLAEHGIIRKPKVLSAKKYLAIEKKLSHLAVQAGMNLAALDLYLWYMKTGVVEK